MRSARFGKYIVLEKLGQGGMAEVHRAIMTGPRGFQKTVALKRILPIFGELADFRERFIEEARVAADLTNSNIVHVFDFGEISGTYYIAMELVDGLDADELVHLARAHGESMLLAAPYVVSQAARGLAFAHGAERDGQILGLVHRDVSPQNILVSRSGEVKVTDFGIVKVTTAVNRLTATGAIMGKLRYMSPEQAFKMPLDGRSDVFALGLVLHELLTGAALLDGPSPAAVIEQLRSGDFPVPSTRNHEVPPDLDAIVANALAHDREARYASADDMARDLERHLRLWGGGFGREELRALLVRLGSVRDVREARLERLRDGPAPISPWFAAGSDSPSSDDVEEETGRRPLGKAGRRVAPAAAASKEDALTQPMSRKNSLASGSQPQQAVVNEPGPRSGSLFRVIAAGVLVGATIVALAWLGRRHTVVGPAEAQKSVVATACRDAGKALEGGDLATAERFYTEALGDPGCIVAYRGLGQVYARNGNTARAVTMFEEYLRAAPAAADAETVRAWVTQLGADPQAPLQP